MVAGCACTTAGLVGPLRYQSVAPRTAARRHAPAPPRAAIQDARTACGGAACRFGRAVRVDAAKHDREVARRLKPHRRTFLEALSCEPSQHDGTPASRV